MVSRAGNPRAKAIACVQRCFSAGNTGSAEPGMQNVVLDRILEVCAVSTNNPGRIGRRLDELRRHRIARRPQLHRPVVNRIGAAQNLGRRISRILVSANCFQDCVAAGFIISVQYMPQGILPGCCRQDVAADLDGIKHRRQPDLRRPAAQHERL